MTRYCQSGYGPRQKTSKVTKAAKKCRKASRRIMQTAGSLGMRLTLPCCRTNPSLGNLDPCYGVRDLEVNLLEADETASLLDPRRKTVGHFTHTSGERWGALGLFCALTCSQCCIWNTWGPIASSVLLAFPSWRKSLVALLSNWGCITYLSCCLPCCWFLNRKGLPTPLRVAAILSTLATFLRCVSSQEVAFTAAAHIAAILNGLSGVLVGPATALVSSVWFPRGERTTATGISAASNQLGMALSYMIGPAVVGPPLFNISGKAAVTTTTENPSMFLRTESISLMLVGKDHPDGTMNTPAANVTANQITIRTHIMSLMRIEFVVQFLVLVGVLGFFPAQPPQPPEVSAMNPCHFGILDSCFHLFQNKSMWRLCGAAALSQGVTGPWLAMITMAFGSSVNQDEADRLAFWTVITSSVLSLTASRVMDVFQGYLKIAIYILLLASAAMFLWVLLLDSRVLAFNKGELYTAVILGISTSWSTPALFLELASEIAFPVSEAIVGGYMIFLANIIGTVFYFSYCVPGIGEHWSSYCVFGNLAISSVLVMFVKDEYNRTKIDISKTTCECLPTKTDSCTVIQKLQQEKVHLRLRCNKCDENETRHKKKRRFK